VATAPLTPQKSPLVLWHLLSLDAPTVAALWTWFIAAVSRVPLPVASPLAMFIAVWMLYAADRLLDASQLNPSPLEARHLFHHRHRNAFLGCIVLASVVLAALLPRIPSEAIHLYLILGGLTFGYFILIHATSSAHRLPKEFAVGLFFAAATFIPTVARDPSLRLPLLLPALLFAALCTFNCLLIYAWEDGPERLPGHANRSAHTTTRFALRHLSFFAAMIIVAGAALSLFNRATSWPISFAITLSAVFLLLLHHRRRRMTTVRLRAAADLVLLTPILLIPFLR
jgi:hypothetical protein